MVKRGFTEAARELAARVLAYTAPQGNGANEYDAMVNALNAFTRIESVVAMYDDEEESDART